MTTGHIVDYSNINLEVIHSLFDEFLLLSLRIVDLYPHGYAQLVESLLVPIMVHKSIIIGIIGIFMCSLLYPCMIWINTDEEYMYLFEDLHSDKQSTKC